MKVLIRSFKGVKSFKKSDFRKHVLTLMSGTVIAQLIMILSSPILTRIYSPSDFGLYGIFTSISIFCSEISTGNLENAIILPKRKIHALNIVGLSLIFVMIFSVVLLVVIYLYSHNIVLFFGDENLSNWIFLIPFSVGVLGFYQILNGWASRNKYYKFISINRITQSGTSSAIQIVSGIVQFRYIGLINGNFFGQLITTALFSFKIKKDLILKDITIKRMTLVLSRFKHFLLFGLPAKLTSTSAQYSLIFLISLYLNSTIVGYIHFLSRIISIPSQLIGRNLGLVFYQKISTMNPYDSYPIVLKFVKKIFILSLVIFIVFYIALYSTFIYIFGAEWSEAIYLIKYLMIVAAFSFVFSSISLLFDYYEKQYINLFWQSFWLLTNILVFYLYSTLNWSITDLFLVYSLKQTTLYAFGIIIILNLSKNKQKHSKSIK